MFIFKIIASDYHCDIYTHFFQKTAIKKWDKDEMGSVLK